MFVGTYREALREKKITIKRDLVDIDRSINDIRHGEIPGDFN